MILADIVFDLPPINLGELISIVAIGAAVLSCASGAIVIFVGQKFVSKKQFWAQTRKNEDIILQLKTSLDALNSTIHELNTKLAVIEDRQRRDG